MARLIFCILCLVSGCGAIQWTSSRSLPNETTVSVCIGENVTLGWGFTVDSSELPINTEWYFQPDGHERTLIATETAGSFMKAPTVSSQLVFVPNAGILLVEVSTTQSGIYYVEVKMNVQGYIAISSQQVTVNVSDSSCNTLDPLDQQITLLTAEINRLETDNQELNSRVEKLANVPLIKDAAERPVSCGEVQRYDPENGVHTLYMPNGVNFRVYCDQSTSGGWAVIQRRLDGTTDFYRGYDEYEKGFGFPEAEFWIGLPNLHLLTTVANSTLRVEVVSFDDQMFYAEYDHFSIGNLTTNFTLNREGHFSHGTLGDAFGYTIGYRPAFSTFDRSSSVDCPSRRHGAFWYTSGCYNPNLNGLYKQVVQERNERDGITWEYSGTNYKRVEMKLKPM